MNPSKRARFPSALAAVFALGVVGTLDFLVQPLGVGMAVRDLSLSESQAGFFASFSEMGAVLSAVLALFWIRRLPWRSTAIVNLLLMAAGYLAATRLETLVALAPARLLVGFAGGNLLAISLAWLADTPRPERLGGLFVASQTAAQIVAFALLPGAALRASGLDGYFLLFLGLAVLGLFCVPWVPLHGRRRLPAIRQQPITGAAEGDGKTRFRAALALCGVGLFFLNTGAFWSYIERIGTAADLSMEAIGIALSVSGFLAFAGSLAASRLGDKISLPYALGIAFLGQLLALGLLLIDLTPALFAFALGQFGFFWNFAMPYQLGALIRNDPSGRRVVLIGAFQSAGMAAGPQLVALWVDLVGLVAMQLVAISAGGASLLLFLILHQLRHGSAPSSGIRTPLQNRESAFEADCLTSKELDAAGYGPGGAEASSPGRSTRSPGDAESAPGGRLPQEPASRRDASRGRSSSQPLARAPGGAGLGARVATG